MGFRRFKSIKEYSRSNASIMLFSKVLGAIYWLAVANSKHRALLMILLSYMLKYQIVFEIAVTAVGTTTVSSLTVLSVAAPVATSSAIDLTSTAVGFIIPRTI